LEEKTEMENKKIKEEQVWEGGGRCRTPPVDIYANYGTNNHISPNLCQTVGRGSHSLLDVLDIRLYFSITSFMLCA
jgi:hypothetical protein